MGHVTYEGGEGYQVGLRIGIEPQQMVMVLLVVL